MGRQVAVNLSEHEESEFFAFLRRSADIQIIRTFASSPTALFVDDLEPRGPDNWTYYVWNKAFAWKPSFAQTRVDLPEVDRRGLHYVSNISTAPILEYSRQAPGEKAAYGRLYWGKYFSAPNGLEYDVESFEAWYEKVARWLRARKAGATRSNTSLERTREG